MGRMASVTWPAVASGAARDGAGGPCPPKVREEDRGSTGDLPNLDVPRARNDPRPALRPRRRPGIIDIETLSIGSGMRTDGRDLAQ